MRDEVLEGVRVRRYRYFIPAWQALAYEGGIVASVHANPLRALQLPFLFAALWWSIVQSVRAWSPDLIHAHWIIPQGLVACLAPRRRVPILCTGHGGDLHGLKSPLMRWLKGWTLRRCARVTVVSASLLEEVGKLAPGISVDVAPMGTDLTTKFVPPPDPRARCDAEIIFVGRLVKGKGVHYLLEAFARVAANHAEVKLTIAGDGPFRVELTSLARRLGITSRVTFLGATEHGRLAALYQRATVAVFPSVGQEGFGLVITEAMGCACPVIASDISAMKEIILPEVTGLLVQPGDPEALAIAIERCLADKGLRCKLAASALTLARSRFDWSSVAQRYRDQWKRASI